MVFHNKSGQVGAGRSLKRKRLIRRHQKRPLGRFSNVRDKQIGAGRSLKRKRLIRRHQKRPAVVFPPSLWMDCGRMRTSVWVIHRRKRMFSTRLFQVYLDVLDFSTENSFAYYYDYFLFLIGIT